MNYIRTKIFAYPSLLCLLVIACSQKDTSKSPNIEEVAEVEIVSIPTTDQLGQFQSPVSGLALWSHPTVPFESTVIAANGEAGLYMIDFENNIVATQEGDFSNGVSVTYLPSDFGVQSLIIAQDDLSNETQLYKMSFEPLAFHEWQVTEDQALLSRKFEAICFVIAPDKNSIKAIEITPESRLITYDVTVVSDVELAISPVRETRVSNVTACTGDSVSNKLYVVQDKQKIGVLDPFTENPTIQPLVELDSNDIDAIRVMNDSTDGYLLVLRQPKQQNYSLQSLNLETGNDIGRFSLGEFSDITAVTSVSAFSADASNFGGLYRNGTIAVVEGNNDFVLKLAPWGAVQNKLNLGTSISLNKRDLAKREDTEVPSPTQKSFESSFKPE